MIVGDNPCFTINQQHGYHMYGLMEDFNHMLDHPPPLPPNTTSASADLELEASVHAPGALIYNLSVLRSKVEQVDAVVNIMVASPSHTLQPAAASAASFLQEIIVAASSMMMALEQLGSVGGGTTGSNGQQHDHQTEAFDAAPAPQPPPSPRVDVVVHVDRNYNEGFYDAPMPAAGGRGENHDTDHKVRGATFADVAKVEPSLDDTGSYGNSSVDRVHQQPDPSTSSLLALNAMCDVIELNAADLLAKYTHYCQICGKGFKRDANLRMHMRAHGDEYKTAAALSKGTPRTGSGQPADQEPAVSQAVPLPQRKYSCPQEGCRWNKGHARFQPLKSMICVKNHYRRSHCPKMYVCNRCNKKRFSVLSDLRTHEKHCGDQKWRCSCGTTFSRKDKLMGHVTLFIGHAPADCHQLLDVQKQRQHN